MIYDVFLHHRLHSFEDSRVSHAIHIRSYGAWIVRYLVTPAHEAVALVGVRYQGHAFALVVGAHAGYATHGVVVHRGADEYLLYLARVTSATAWVIAGAGTSLVVATTTAGV